MWWLFKVPTLVWSWEPPWVGENVYLFVIVSNYSSAGKWHHATMSVKYLNRWLLGLDILFFSWKMAPCHHVCKVYELVIARPRHRFFPLERHPKLVINNITLISVYIKQKHHSILASHFFFFNLHGMDHGILYSTRKFVKSCSTINMHTWRHLTITTVNFGFQI